MMKLVNCKHNYLIAKKFIKIKNKNTKTINMNAN